MLRLKVERLRRALTQQELGYKAKIQASEISKIECGVMLPYPGQRARLARVLGLEPDTLLEEVEGVSEVSHRTAAVGAR